MEAVVCSVLVPELELGPFSQSTLFLPQAAFSGLPLVSPSIIPALVTGSRLVLA